MKKPTNTTEFDIFMNKIDSILKETNVPIHARPIRSFQIISTMLHIELRITGCGLPIPNDYNGNSFSAHVFKWFDDRYGDRLKIDFSLAHIILMIKNDPYRCRIPQIYGSAKFILDPTFEKRPTLASGTKESPAPMLEINVYELIEHLTIHTIMSLTLNEKIELMKFFSESCNTIYKLKEIKDLPFRSEANSDLKIAVDSLLSTNNNYGLSKWSSLQFTEKIMKGFLKMKNIEFKKNHNLKELKTSLKNNNIVNIPDIFIKKIQCSAEVRYNKELVSLNEAFDAHQASLELLRFILINYYDQIHKV